MVLIITIDLHGYTLEKAKAVFESRFNNAVQYGEKVIRVIHGHGKHSEVFPVIKSYIRHWVEESELARQHIETVYRGEDGSPYTTPNSGETIIVLKGETGIEDEEIDWDDEEEFEKRDNSKRIRADKLRKLRRQHKYR
ncbi:MAG TPA: Smr/MutS family protein [Bacillota bacterium]|nr:Smr/MutS family protein [Bacillota bacterium]HOL10304.1 Smr/MutS family protein [Bacillota bacterium]HPO98106.1 Smr/MutS family protein [Bacillota bacterium]